MLHTSHGVGQERVNFFRRRHFCSALYGNFLTYMCNELELCWTTLRSFRQCILKSVTAGKHGNSDLWCKELHMFINSCLDQRIRSRACTETKTAFSEKDQRERCIWLHLCICLYVDPPEFYNVTCSPPLVSTNIVSQCSRVEWTWQRCVSWTLPQYTTWGPLQQMPVVLTTNRGCKHYMLWKSNHMLE